MKKIMIIIATLIIALSMIFAQLRGQSYNNRIENNIITDTNFLPIPPQPR